MARLWSEGLARIMSECSRMKSERYERAGLRVILRGAGMTPRRGASDFPIGAAFSRFLIMPVAE